MENIFFKVKTAADCLLRAIWIFRIWPFNYLFNWFCLQNFVMDGCAVDLWFTSFVACLMEVFLKKGRT